jgi:arylsulfatase
MGKGDRTGSTKGTGHGARASEHEPSVKTYVEGQPFPGCIGRTWDVSEPAFPVAPTPPKGAPVTTEYEPLASFHQAMLRQ